MSDATSRTGMKRATPSQDDARFSVPPASIRRVEVDGVQVFYRAAGEVNAPAVLLLHGFPTSSFMFRELIPRLANDYRVIAPDFPGFGFTEVPPEQNYRSEEHTSELQSRLHLVCRLLLEKKKKCDIYMLPSHSLGPLSDSSLCRARRA